MSSNLQHAHVDICMASAIYKASSKISKSNIKAIVPFVNYSSNVNRFRGQNKCNTKCQSSRVEILVENESAINSCVSSQNA